MCQRRNPKQSSSVRRRSVAQARGVRDGDERGAQWAARRCRSTTAQVRCDGGLVRCDVGAKTVRGPRQAVVVDRDEENWYGAGRACEKGEVRGSTAEPSTGGEGAHQWRAEEDDAQRRRVMVEVNGV
ncbi:hypothetical protein U1Q18_034283 [Sarracenia purpurea var. burkii]